MQIVPRSLIPSADHLPIDPLVEECLCADPGNRRVNSLSFFSFPNSICKVPEDASAAELVKLYRILKQDQNITNDCKLYRLYLL